MTFESDSDLVCEYLSWLSGFDPQFGRNWKKLKEHNPEAAMCEAAARRLLEQNGNEVEPNETLDGKRQSPDFRCTQAGKLFFVEVTCISIAKTADLTGLTHIPDESFHLQGYGRLNDVIFHETIVKTPQCSNLGKPALVAVGTFHWQASQLCFERRHIALLLTGETLIAQNLEAATGDPVGDAYLSTNLRSATFLKPSQDGWMSHARNPVSGILACGFGCDPPHVRCALHPQPVHLFDRNFLPKIECCRLKQGYEAGRLSTEWI